MPMTMVITRDVEHRFRGFLGSIMLELAPGVYAHPRMSMAVRGRVVDVITEWYGALRRGSIIVSWDDTSQNGRLGLKTFGTPPKSIVVHDGTLLVRRALTVYQKSC